MKNYLSAPLKAVKKFKKAFQKRDRFGFENLPVREEIQENLPLSKNKILSLDDFRKKQEKR